MVIPNSDHAHEVLKSIQAKLEQLNLELNTEKTEIYLNREDFLSDTAPDEYLDELQLRFDQIINPVWIMNPALRSGFRKKYNGANEEWWYLISSYKFCLDKIGVYTHVSDLSRKVYAYIFNQIRCQEDLHGNSELLFAALPEENQLESLNRWQIEFSTANVEWFEKKNLLAAELSSLVNETWGQIGSLNPEDGRELRILTRRLRFAINRLLQLGLLEVSDSVVDILCSSPWLYRDPANVIEGLAQQGLTVEVLKIIEYYSSRNNVTDEYMTAASIRALRSFDEITLELWEQLIIHATNQSVAVSLLATETWLALGPKVNTLVRDDDIRKIEDTLKDSVNLIPRLRKNYLLILGKYGNGKPLSYVVNDDLVSRQAQDIVMSGNVSSLFNYFEPNIIRQTFYSGFRTSEDDQLDMMVSY